jgi:anti-anti-sigma factor
VPGPGREGAGHVGSLIGVQRSLGELSDLGHVLRYGHYYRVQATAKHFPQNIFGSFQKGISVMARNVTGMENNDSLTIDFGPDGVVVVHGDIDVAGGPILETAIIEREIHGPVVIDLGDVFFIDSSGLRSLLGASRRARERGSRVVLRDVGPEVLRLLEITGTTDRFSIERSNA